MIVVVLVKEEFIFEKKRKMLLLRGLELPFLKTIKKKSECIQTFRASPGQRIKMSQR